MALEIEHKYLLPQFPTELLNSGELQLSHVQRIEQTYLAYDSNEEIRVRRLEEERDGQRSVYFTHTFKRGQGLVREEMEYEISAEIYAQLLAAVGYSPLVKTRTTLIYQGRSIEIDEYAQFKLVVAEVEFASLHDAEQFVAPAWFGAQLDRQFEYSNKQLWMSLQKQV